MLCKTGRLICYGKRSKIGNGTGCSPCFVLVLGMMGMSGSVKAADQTDSKMIDIMFVHDTHSHLNSFSTVVDEKTGNDRRVCKDQDADR